MIIAASGTLCSAATIRVLRAGLSTIRGGR